MNASQILRFHSKHALAKVVNFGSAQYSDDLMSSYIRLDKSLLNISLKTTVLYKNLWLILRYIKPPNQRSNETMDIYIYWRQTILKIFNDAACQVRDRTQDLG
jgi:hypothetical protein